MSYAGIKWLTRQLQSAQKNPPSVLNQRRCAEPLTYHWYTTIKFWCFAACWLTYSCMPFQNAKFLSSEQWSIVVTAHLVCPSALLAGQAILGLLCYSLCKMSKNNKSAADLIDEYLERTARPLLFSKDSVF